MYLAIFPTYKIDHLINETGIKKSSVPDLFADAVFDYLLTRLELF